jgi:3-hydroxyisobutyrate/3-hydroxypropionate dehydrogenase
MTIKLTKSIGYPMAKNLRAKIPESDTMTVFDVNSSSSEKLTKEADLPTVQVAKGPREVAEKSV